MTASIAFQFVIATLLPVLATIVLFEVQQRTAFGAARFWVQQAVIGLVFGVLAIIGTEFGIDTGEAVMNVRDAAPIVGGLLFGGPAGIIAGVIGGVERWIATLWGRGLFTRLGCSIATIAVGFYAAWLRRYLFDNKRPTLLVALLIGALAEVMHLTLIFVTNMGQAARAISVVQACSIPMITANGIAVMLSVLAVDVLDWRASHADSGKLSIAQLMQTGMVIPVVVACMVTSGFTYLLQTGVANEQTKELLSLYIEDVKDEVRSTSDANLLVTTRRVANEVGTVEHAKELDLKEFAERYGVTEVNVVDESGIIVNSTFPDFEGFDMSSGGQSAEFLTLLDGSTTELVQSYQPMTYERNNWRKYAAVTIPGGFVQVGYGTLSFQMQMAEQIAGVATNRHVGESGGIVVVDAQDVVVSAYQDIVGQSLQSTGLGWVTEGALPGAVFTSDFMGDKVYGMLQRTEGYRIIAIEPVKEANFSRDAAFLLGSFTVALVFGTLFVAIYFLVKQLVVNNIHRINTTLGLITDGDLNAVVDVHTNEEFSELSDDINLTVTALKRAIADEAARMAADLEYARKIQQSALPMVFPPFPSHEEFQIYANMDAAKEVGGDFYDFYLLDEDHLVFLIADVSGKGIPAALFMMTAKTLLKSLAESGIPVDEVMRRANQQLCEGNEAEMFVTCWMGVLDLQTGHVTYANAGHNPPALAHAEGGFSFEVVRPNMVLAGIEGVRYRAQGLDLKPGDTLFLYTDGVTEATRSDNELFGEDRLIASLNEHGTDDVELLCHEVHADVDAFVGDAPQFDDITVLALRYLGRKQS